MSFSAALDRFSVAFIFCNVGFDPTVPQQFPCRTCIKATIHVEYRTFVVQPTAFHINKHLLELLHKVITVIMIASNHTSGRNNQSIPVGYRQDIAGFCFLSSLVRDFFAPFFAALWLPSRLSSDKFSSPRTETILASKSRWRLPSLLHLRK